MEKKIPVITADEDRYVSEAIYLSLPTCEACNRRYGEPTLLGFPACDCGEYFRDKIPVVCVEGRHFHIDCYEQLKKDGYVEPVGHD